MAALRQLFKNPQSSPADDTYDAQDEMLPEGPPAEDGELHRRGLEHLQAGEWQTAEEYFTELTERHPGQDYYQQLLEQARLREKLDDNPPRRQADRSLLRSRSVWILTVLNLILWTAVFGRQLYQQQIVPALQQRQVISQQQQLLEAGRELVAAGQLDEAAERFRQVLEIDADNAAAQTALEEINRRQQLAQTYSAAMTDIEEGDWQAALDKLEAIRQQDPGYREVPQQLERVRGLAERSGAFQAAEQHFQAGEWQAAIDQLLRIREERPDFRPEAVQALLADSYVKQAEAVLSELGQRAVAEQITGLQGVLTPYEQALEVEPGHPEATTGAQLVETYRAGLEAVQQGDWESASQHLSDVYAAAPDYAGGEAADLLKTAYVEQAGGALSDLGAASVEADVEQLQAAIPLLERAQEIDPTDGELAARTDLAREMLAGLEAFASESWESAGVHLSNVFAADPAYAGGRAAELLQTAYVESGNRYLRAEKSERAAERYRQAIALELVNDENALSATADERLGTGDEFFRQAQYRDAIVAYDAVLEELELRTGDAGAIEALRAELDTSEATPSPTPAPQPATQTTYVVQPGDTLSGIAQRFDTTVAALLEANDMIWDRSLIRPGWELVIPQP